MTATYLIGLAVLAALIVGLIMLTRREPTETARRGSTQPPQHELICPSEDCRHANETQAKYCGRCGRPLAGRSADNQHKE